MYIEEKYLVKKGYKYVFTSSYKDIKEPYKWYDIQGFKSCEIIDRINLLDSTSKEIFSTKTSASLFFLLPTVHRQP